MKKFFVFFLVFLLLAAAGAVIFMLTFDADRYRPLIIDKIEESTGFGVNAERISLGWAGGVALQVRQFTLYQDRKKQNELFKLESLSMLIDVFPLMNRQLKVGSIVVQSPDIRLVRGADGRIRGFEESPGRPVKESGNNDAVAGVLLLSAVSRIEIEDGRFSFRDEGGGYVSETVMEDIDAVIKDLSLTGSVPFNVKASFAGTNQNIEMSGRFRINPFEFEQVGLETDLGRFRVDEFLRMFPRMRTAGLEKVKGNFSADIRGLKPGAPAIWEKGALRLADGRVQIQNYPPLENLGFDANLNPDGAEIQKISGTLGQGDFSFSGNVRVVQSVPLAALRGEIKNLDLGQILSGSTQQGMPSFRGIAGLSIEGTARGAEGASLLQTSAGKGQFTLQKGVIENLNILQEVFSRFSMIPGLVPRLQRSLPPSYQDKLQARDTYLEPIAAPFTIDQGVLYFNQWTIASDSIALVNAQGSVSQEFVRAQALLVIDPELSAALIRSVQEFASLANQEGQLVIPMNVQGPPSRISVLPDLQYVASKLAVSTLSNFFAPKRTAQEPSIDPVTGQPVAVDPGALPATQGETSEQSGSGLESLRKMKGKDLLAQFLGSALQGQDSEAGSSQQ